ncbi:MAG: hypothetical protein IIC01_13320 [Planctomycetes bacterium]|nr:hypothetical protein [Planctomycetota bacterium]
MYGSIAYYRKTVLKKRPPLNPSTTVAVKRTPRGNIFGRGLTAAGSPIATIFSIGSSIASIGFRIIGFGLVFWGGLSIIRHAFAMVVGDITAIGGHAQDVKNAIIDVIPARA